MYPKESDSQDLSYFTPEMQWFWKMLRKESDFVEKSWTADSFERNVSDLSFRGQDQAF